MVLGDQIHLVASDLDGTLLRRDGSISPRTVSAVSSAVHAGAVTGEHPIPRETALQVVDILRAELAEAAFAVEAGSDYGQEPAYPNQWPLPPGAVIAGVETLVMMPVAKLVVRHRAPGDHWEVLARVRSAVGELAEVTSSGPGAPIELAAPGISKASALALLASVAGVEARKVLAFGDMPNDLSMLTWAGTSVAPANAHPEVLATVDYVTTDCDHDGVAVFLEGLLGPR